jgi:hypothetical protein
MRVANLRTWLVAILAASTLLGACAPERPGLSYSNGTTISIDIIVNGAKVASLAPGADGTIAAATLPALPWTVFANTTGGRTLEAMTVKPGDVVQSGETQRGVAARVDLSCGRLDFWVGPPLSGPAPGPGTPGDCNP